MFRKLLKYENRSAARYGNLLICLIPVLALLIGTAVSMLSKFHPEGNPTAQMLTGALLVLVIGVCVLGLVTIFTILWVLLLYGFFKSTVTDEGYLTFTLPVTAKDVILAKALNILRWMAEAILVGVASALIVVPATTAIVTNSSFFDFYTLLGDWLASALTDSPVTCIFGLLLLVAQTVSAIMLPLLAIALGSLIAKKNKLLAAVGMIFAVNAAQGLIWQILSIFLTVPMAFIELPEMVSVNIMLGVMTAVYAAFAVVAYILCRNIFEKHLNLE